MAGDSLKMAVDVLNGKKPAETTVLLDPKLITAENLKDYKGWTAAR
jgi:ribose transport system substrate-binding protein